MNLFQLVLKQMRQRALSTCLTLLSVMLGVALAIALIVFSREGGKLFGQTEYGYDLVIGAKGSRLQLVLNTVYHLDEPTGTIRWDVYESLFDRALAAELPRTLDLAEINRASSNPGEPEIRTGTQNSAVATD